MKTFYGNYETKLDNKYRFVSPSKLNLEPNDEIAYIKDNSNIRIYLLERLNQIVDYLKNKSFEVLDETTLQKIDEELNFIFNYTFDTGKVDDQKRILIPKQARENFDTKFIGIQGRCDYIIVSPSDEITYTSYKKRGRI